MTQVNYKKAKTLEEKIRVKAMIDLKPKKIVPACDTLNFRFKLMN